MSDFARVQAQSFFKEEEQRSAWVPWLKNADMRNLGNPRQDFFVQYVGREPVACALSPYESSFAGIYAVATVPSHRRQGRALSLLRRAIQAANSRGFALIGLQTVEASSAEALYLGAGFRSLFKMRVLEKVGR
jgi:GNAT superfamily N-acetyltransferase